MRLKLPVLVVTIILIHPLVTAAQQSPDAATDIYAEQVQSVLKNMIGVTIDRQLKVADFGGDENVAVGILHRTDQHDTDGAHRGLVHAYVTEVYVMLSGWGTLLTGGELFNQGELSGGSIAIGPSFNAESRGGLVREIEEGDIVVIPAGLMHAWTSIPDHVTYLSVRIDPDQVLPTGYVNPEID
jgi:mannose-6-phosphate isomerase-like protein (cupin superfamily)